MKGTDKFLFGIVIGVILLAASAFGVAMLRDRPAYMAEDTPTGAACAQVDIFTANIK